MSLVNRKSTPYQYLNVNIIHNVQNGNDSSIASASIVRTAPIINDAKDYLLTVQRMSIPIVSIPSFVASLRVGTNLEDNQMIYSFTASYNGTDGPETFVVWEPQNTIWPQPTGLVQYSLQSDKPFYHAYNISSVCNMMSETIQQALIALDAIAALPPDYTMIQFYFDPVQGCPVLLVPVTCIDIELYFNNQSASLFATWRYISVARNDVNGMDNLLTFFSTPQNTIDGMVYLRPESFDYNYWSPVQSIQIRTTLPIVNEAVPPVNFDFNATSTLQNPPQAYPDSTSILTDFELDTSMFTVEGGYFVYNKVDSTRFTNFSGSGPINSFNVGVFWVDVSNAAYPMTLQPGCSVSFKILFIPAIAS